MTESTDAKQIRNGRIKLLALLAIFILPLLVAILMHRHYRDGGGIAVSSNGELITPAVPLSDFRLRSDKQEQPIDLEWMKSKWTFLYFADANCGDICQQNIYHMRQIHISLGKEAHRLQRLLVANDLGAVNSFIGSDYPKLVLGTPITGGLADQIGDAVSGLPHQTGGMFLIDPLGNLMMRFSPELNPKGVLRDIKRVLRASRIG